VALICRELGLLFIMAPHTGCTAIGQVLRDRFEAAFLPPEDILDGKGVVRIPRKHTTLRQLLDEGLLTPQERAMLVVAAGVRNPYDEEVSHYKQRERTYRARRDDPETRRKLVGDKPPPATLKPMDFETWLRGRYVRSPLQKALGRAAKRPADFTEDADVVVRFERLQADVDALMARLGVTEHVEVPIFNPTAVREKRPYQEFYTPAARDIVARTFADRIARYGYQFEDASPDLDDA
jgi:hypothetical protein